MPKFIFSFILFFSIILPLGLIAQGPSVMITFPFGNPQTRLDTLPVKFTFSTNVQGFQLSDIQFNGNVSVLGLSGSGAEYIAYYKANSCTKLFVGLLPGAAQDSATNPSQGASAVFTRADTCAPQPTIIPQLGNPTGANPFPVKVDFGEPVTGFTLTDLIVTNGTASNLVSENGMDSSFMVMITPMGTDTALVSLKINAAMVMDLASYPNDSVITTVLYDPAHLNRNKDLLSLGWKIGPNPMDFDKTLNIHAPEEVTYWSWKIIDIQGKIVKEGEVNTSDTKVLFDQEMSGIYWVILQTENYQSTFKLHVLP